MKPAHGQKLIFFPFLLTFRSMVSWMLGGRRIIVNWGWDLTVRYINTHDILAMAHAIFSSSEVVNK